MTKGIFKILAAKQIGNEAYPPIPNTKLGFSFFKIKIDFNIATKILKKE